MVDLDSITLARGSHASRADGMCLLEAAAYLAGEPHTHQPQCVCPVLAAFGRTWNDGIADEDRDRLLKPFIPLLIGTRSTREVQERRAFLAADWLARVYTPVWLRAAGLAFEAAELEALPPLTSVESCALARPVIVRAKVAAEAARAAAVAARAAAWDSAWADAVAAALDAAVATAGYAAIDAAVADDRVAARDAAMDVAAAQDAAVAVAAAGGALRPHIEQLQASAVDLYRRMIEVAA